MSNTLLFNKVISKTEQNTRAGIKYLYTLRDGTELLTKNDFDVNSWYFFEFGTTKLGQRYFVSSASVPHADAKEYEQLLINLKKSVFDLEKVWKQLNVNERQIVMRGFGIGIGAATTGTFLFNAIGSFIGEELIAGSLTGGLSTVVSLGSAAFTYLQIEEMKESLKAHSTIMAEFKRQKAAFDRKLIRFTPPQYDNLPIANPEFKSIVTRLKSVVPNITLENFTFLGFDEMKFAGVTA